MNIMDAEEDPVVKKLSKKTKKLKIEDNDVGDWDEITSAFTEHFHPQGVAQFCKNSGSRRPACLFSDLFCEGKTVLCGLENGICKPIDVSKPLDERIVVDFTVDRSHTNLSCIRCSRVSPHIFFSSSSSEGTVQQWDLRQNARKPCQRFSSVESNSDSANKPKLKPILQFDVSCNDQLLCAGTEKVEEDSYILFWDTRSTKILGAYWESHSDDVTAIRFHPEQIHALSSGSTDGLLNVFNLMEPAEDDALLYSFNTNSSVDLIHWYCPPGADAKVVCVTHTNEVQVWNSNTGDPVVEIKRKSMADAMMRSNPEAVYISGCYNLGTSSVSVMANSLSGSGNTRLIKLDDEMKPMPYGIFMDLTSVVQTAQYIPLTQHWLTFDEHGVVKTWTSTSNVHKEVKPSSKKTSKKSVEERTAKRFKPYQKD